MKPVILETFTDVLVAMLQGHEVKVSYTSVFNIPDKHFDIEPPNSKGVIVISKDGVPVTSNSATNFDELMAFTFPEEDNDPPIMYYVPKWDADLSREKPVLVLATNDQEFFYVGFAYEKDDKGLYTVSQYTNDKGKVLFTQETKKKFSQANPIEVQNVGYP